MHAVPAPRFDLVEVAQVGVERIVSLFVGPVAHYTVAASTDPSSPAPQSRKETTMEKTPAGPASLGSPTHA